MKVVTGSAVNNNGVLQGIVDMAAYDAEEPHVRVQFPLDLHKDGLLLSKHLAEKIRLICLITVWVYLNPPFRTSQVHAELEVGNTDMHIDGALGDEAFEGRYTNVCRRCTRHDGARHDDTRG